MGVAPFAQKLIYYLEDARTLSLATVSPEGEPYAANINFVYDDQLHLYFISSESSNHSQHIARDPKIAATIYTPFVHPQDIRGIQLKGTCQAIPDEHFETIWKLFEKRMPDAEQFKLIALTQTLYQITPNWIRFIDNTERFGYKEETVWPMVK